LLKDNPTTPVFDRAAFYSWFALVSHNIWLGSENGTGWRALGPDLTAAADVLREEPDEEEEDEEENRAAGKMTMETKAIRSKM
jgi:hypothetical protein